MATRTSDDKWVTFRVTREEHKTLISKATSSGFPSVSEYARTRLLTSALPDARIIEELDGIYSALERVSVQSNFIVDFLSELISILLMRISPKDYKNEGEKDADRAAAERIIRRASRLATERGTHFLLSGDPQDESSCSLLIAEEADKASIASNRAEEPFDEEEP